MSPGAADGAEAARSRREGGGGRFNGGFGSGRKTYLKHRSCGALEIRESAFAELAEPLAQAPEELVCGLELWDVVQREQPGVVAPCDNRLDGGLPVPVLARSRAAIVQAHPRRPVFIPRKASTGERSAHVSRVVSARRAAGRRGKTRPRYQASLFL